MISEMEGRRLRMISEMEGRRLRMVSEMGWKEAEDDQ